jgi:hypothetical protein
MGTSPAETQVAASSVTGAEPAITSHGMTGGQLLKQSHELQQSLDRVHADDADFNIYNPGHDDSISQKDRDSGATDPEKNAQLTTEGEGEAEEAPTAYLTGWRLHLTTLGIVLSLLLVNLEVSIVGTSLVAITNDLQGFSETSWIVSGYLVTYMGT